MAKDDELTFGESLFCYTLVMFIVVVGISQIVAVFRQVSLTAKTAENMQTIDRIRTAVVGDTIRPVYTPGEFSK